MLFKPHSLQLDEVLQSSENPFRMTARLFKMLD